MRAADLWPKTYVEAQAEGDAYVASLKARPVAVLHAGPASGSNGHLRFPVRDMFVEAG